MRYNGEVKHIAIQLQKNAKKSNETERGELMRYFMRQLNLARMRDNMPLLTMGRMGKLLQGIPTKDLYYLKRICDDAPHFSKKFWWEMKPENHTEEARAKRLAESSGRFQKRK